MNLLRTLLTLALCLKAEASIQKLCVPEQMTSAPSFFLSVNGDSPKAAEAMNASLSLGKVVVEKENDSPLTQFILKPLHPKDCLLLNPDEAAELDVKSPQLSGKAKLQPAVLFREADRAKLFGFLEVQSLSQLREVPHRELSQAALLSHLLRQHDLSFLVVLCPKKRESACELTVRHRGKWLKDKHGKKLTYRVLAKAKGAHGRVLHGGDTPQGIYYLWASMFTEEAAFGKAPRIDLDANSPPINTHPYEIHSYLLARLAPREAWDDYWINEWPLAYRLGRIHLRVHGNASETREEFNTTAGCLNTGAKTGELLSNLEALGLLEGASSRARHQSDPESLGWRVSPALGKAFLIVKDRD